MFLEVIFVSIFIVLWIMLNYYAWFASNFSMDNDSAIKNSLIVHWWRDYNLQVHAMSKWELDMRDKLETVSDIAYLETSKKQNFININVWKAKWTFELKLSAPCKISWVVYRDTENIYDVQFTQSLNKYSINYSTYKDNNRVLNLSLDDSAFDNWYVSNWKNKAYYVYVPKEKPVDTIYFTNSNENKDRIITLFVEPYNIWEKVWWVQQKNTEKVYTNVWNSSQQYYDWVRYILKKSDLNNKLELNNFVLISSNRRFWAAASADWQNKIIVNYSSPLMFYINEFSDT